MDPKDIDALARAVAKLLPTPPSSVTPIEYVAILLAVLLALSAMLFLFFGLPRLIDRVVQAIKGIGEKIDAERAERDQATRTHVSGIHEKLDGLDDKVTNLRVTVAKRLPPSWWSKERGKGDGDGEDTLDVVSG